MPVLLNPNYCQDKWRPRPKQSNGTHSPFQTSSARCVTIGLVNNMSDGALEATERQFLSLLDAASNGLSVRLSLYSLPGVPRNERGARHIHDFYSSTQNLWNTRLDGLIVTGREPLNQNLRDEPYWKSFTEVVDWARDNTHSTIWSCLAAHGAVLHMDGIRRVRSGHKHSGVFECVRRSSHPLLAGAPSQYAIPHSRWNGTPEDELAASGYTVLTRSGEIGVDTFVRQQNSLFIFFQGHPEYAADTLLLEYRRDVKRYLRGQTNAYPALPRNYFDPATELALTTLQEDAMVHPRGALFADLSARLEVNLENTWRSTAVCIYRNWLEHLSAQKRLGESHSKFIKEPRRLDAPIPLTAAV